MLYIKTLIMASPFCEVRNGEVVEGRRGCPHFPDSCYTCRRLLIHRHAGLPQNSSPCPRRIHYNSFVQLRRYFHTHFTYRYIMHFQGEFILDLAHKLRRVACFSYLQSWGAFEYPTRLECAVVRIKSSP
jgi:hypothetical protein